MVTMQVDSDNGPSVPPSVVLPKAMDELQYSRLIYTLGKEAVERLHQSRVLIVGSGGLGAEISKNLLLSGIGGIGLVDDDDVAIRDLGSNFCLREGDVGRNRAVCTAENLREFNPSVDVEVIAQSSMAASLASYHLAMVTSGKLPDLVRLNWLCRSLGVPFIAAQARGLFSYVFTDLGDSWCFKDEIGESPGILLVANVTQENPATVTIVEEQRHALKDGDEVTFSGIKGMQELNQAGTFRVTVTGTHTFTIPIDTRAFGRYLSGGYFQKVNPFKRMHSLPLERSLTTPIFPLSDNLELSREPQMHVALQAIDEYERLTDADGLNPHGAPFGEADIDKILIRAREIWEISTFGRSKVCLNDSEVVTHESDSGKNVIGDPDTTVHKERADKANWENYMDQLGLATEEVGLTNGGNCSGKTDEIQIGEFGEHSEGFMTTLSSKGDGLDVKLVRLLAQATHIELCPVVALTGGLAAQEIVKAVGKVSMPLHQWMYYDATDCAPPQLGNMSEKAPLKSRYDLQIALYGKDFQQKLGNLQWLVVGAGGIGCEVLKNLVLMGVGCSFNGSIVVTDMDCISKPNLTDQLLYHEDDLGRQKTPTAGRALRKMNPTAQIRAFQEKFDVETEGIFDSSFFQSISGVFSAVDSASARLYIDMRCVTFRRPMIDGGKHGTKGSVQVFLPFQSEMYASTPDPPESKESPICTIRNFPYLTEHALQWAIETFESLFKQRPGDVNAYLSNREFQESVRKANPSTRLPILETLRDALLQHKPLSFEACIHWARLQFEDLFSNNIRQLCFNFPEDMMTAMGAPFWSGTKRAPVPIAFDIMEPLHYDFIVAAANLQATIYGLKGCQDQSLFVDVLQNVEIAPFQPKEGIKIAVTDNEPRSAQQKNSLSSEDNDAAEACEVILRELPTPASLAGYRLSPISFEKDDERNFHVEFVLAAANLRAENYGIPPSDKLQARLVGGRAVPSIVTATAVIGGLMCLELYKIQLEKPLSCYKHSYFNLGVPFFSTADPIKAIVNTVERSHRAPLLWTLWDKFEMNCVGMSLETFLGEFKQQHGLEITMLSYGKSLLYAEFVPKKKLQERMRLTLLELIAAVGKVTIPVTESKVIFSLSCSDASENDVDVPDIIVQVR